VVAQRLSCQQAVDAPPACLPAVHTANVRPPPPPNHCSKAPIQAFADRVSAVFVPVVAALAVLTWLAWYTAGRLAWYPDTWLPKVNR
jgi:hypothetical protein